MKARAMHHDLVPFVVFLLTVAVLIGLRETPCDNGDCTRVHDHHRRIEAQQRRERLEKEAHKGHSRDWPDERCTYCQGGGWER